MIGVEERLTRIIANELHVEGIKIQPAARFGADLGADPFGVLEVIVSVEDEFKIDIPNSALEKLQTVGDLVAIVKGFQV